MTKIKNLSPLRYPGGKAKLSEYIKKLIYQNNLNNSYYIEPFAGGAGVALYLLINKHVSKIFINDLDKSIYAFWYSVLNHTDELCSMIENTPVNLEQWFIQKNIQKNKEFESLLNLGFSTFFLNRTNRSGIIKAGVIGGYAQKGNYKIDCRFNKDELIDRIKLISSFKDSIELHNLDVREFIDYIIPSIKKQSFIFFDPPYYNKGSQLYVNYFTHEDHLELSHSISEIKNHYWIVTYDYEPKIQNMYRQFHQVSYALNYTAGKKYTGYEIMVFSDNINLPEDYESII